MEDRRGSPEPGGPREPGEQARRSRQQRVVTIGDRDPTGVVGIDVDEHLRCAGHPDTDQGRHRSVRHHRHAIARPHAERAQCECERIGVVGHANRMRDTQVPGECPLECIDPLPQHVTTTVQYIGDRGIDLGTLRVIPGARIGLGNGRGRKPLLQPDGGHFGSIGSKSISRAAGSVAIAGCTNPTVASVSASQDSLVTFREG